MMAVRGNGQLPVGRWLSATGRALVFGVSVVVLERAIFTTLAPLATRGPQALLVWSATATLAAALISGALLIRLLDGRSPGALGLSLSRQVPRELGVGMVAGVVPQLAAALLLVLVGGLAFLTEPGSAWGWVVAVGRALLLLVLAAAAEEAVYRGYGFQALVRGIGRWPTLVITSAVFALAHARNPAVTPLALGNIFLAGLVLGLAYLKTLSLWLVTALHAGWNWSMASLLDLPVSGLLLFNTPGYEPALSAPPWLGGGAFGPEGGLVGTAALLLALLIATRWPELGPSAPQLAARPLAGQSEDMEND